MFFKHLKRLLFDFELVSEDLFRSVLPEDPNFWQGGPRALYGGQVAAQALSAAYKTISDDKLCHSFHSYFLLPGEKNQVIDYSVKRLRDGRSFSTRMVEGRQADKTIFAMMASFSVEEDDNLVVKAAMPEVTPPEQLDIVKMLTEFESNENFPEKTRGLAKEQREFYELRSPIRIEPVDPLAYMAQKAVNPPMVHFWTLLREAESSLTESQKQILVAYLADFGILRSSVVADPKKQYGLVTSLDHSVFYHGSLDPCSFSLMESKCPNADNSRAFHMGHIWRRDGHLVATVMQEALMRGKRPSL